MDSSHIQDIKIRAGIITVSSTRNESSDESGKEIKTIFRKNGINVDFYTIIPDSEPQIQKVCTEALKVSNCIVISGGTGLTHDDVTIEAVEPLFDKKIDGFGEIFRLKSYEEIGTRSLLSRASAGIISKKAVFCIPGSTGAVKLAMNDIIIPEIKHVLTHAGK
ncbi:molybdenum cofactor biosynthesis protein B [Methanomicrobium sp. W14]|uniref:MogA/MoaB family molybdenum cofactor biosynthesis protein n=1 Tax=Methanomicrobium sp. W14 TaxID=2817839 RepID=UPI001AEB9E50|nr:molybdenum cofactor biosynthesis protein B [Methanomicrobium sp. W14]MBP2132587.1 molybdenum cofactor biosynthesis protein B [Methanomicrobium sp. W14]